MERVFRNNCKSLVTTHTKVCKQASQSTLTMFVGVVTLCYQHLVDNGR